MSQLRKRYRQDIVHLAECFFRPRLTTRRAQRADHRVNSPSENFRQEEFQLLGNWICQLAARWQGLPSWSDDLSDRRMCDSLHQGALPHQPSCSENQHFHGSLLPLASYSSCLSFPETAAFSNAPQIRDLAIGLLNHTPLALILLRTVLSQ